MYNPTRRNRNIGTAKQGYGQNNILTIPKPCYTSKNFYERLEKYEKYERIINGHKFTFVVEETRRFSKHACTISDIEKIIFNLPKSDYGNLELIILRQPKRKEETLSPVWGRLIYSYEFENDYFPAIIIEAIDLKRKFKWTRKLSPESQKELKRLKEDGHKILDNKKYYISDYDLEKVRNTQLYRTLLHEFGHYVHYLETIVRPLTKMKDKLDKLSEKINDNDTAKTNPNFEKWDELDDKYNEEINKLEEIYFRFPKSEKEKFAHNYAKKLKEKLMKIGIIPFERIE